MRQREGWGTGYDGKKLFEGQMPASDPAWGMYVPAGCFFEADRLWYGEYRSCPDILGADTRRMDGNSLYTETVLFPGGRADIGKD